MQKALETSNAGAHDQEAACAQLRFPSEHTVVLRKRDS
jgi:hypothetical protein